MSFDRDLEPKSKADRALDAVMEFAVCAGIATLFLYLAFEVWSLYSGAGWL